MHTKYCWPNLRWHAASEHACNRSSLGTLPAPDATAQPFGHAAKCTPNNRWPHLTWHAASERACNRSSLGTLPVLDATAHRDAHIIPPAPLDMACSIRTCMQQKQPRHVAGPRRCNSASVWTCGKMHTKYRWPHLTWHAASERACNSSSLGTSPVLDATAHQVLHAAKCTPNNRWPHLTWHAASERACNRSSLGTLPAPDDGTAQHFIHAAKCTQSTAGPT